MSEELKYITYDEALVVYSKTVAASGGGLQGVKDEGGIRKVLDFVQNDLYYPTFAEKLTYLANEDYPEDLKLELIHAIGDQSVEFEESDDNRH